MSSIFVTRNAAEMQSAISKWRIKKAKIALIPTMGSLHNGHLAHLSYAKERAERVVVSIFVNPAQFAAHEDFDRYPRNIDSDTRKLQSAGGTDLIYAPGVNEVYPNGINIESKLGGLACGLESDFRPYFFSGVVTVIEKLFRQVTPDFATFGEKDFQQLRVVESLVAQLKMNIEILPVPIVREKDGLALSSRNAYLTVEERKIAPTLFYTVQNIAARVRAGHDIAQAEAEGNAALVRSGFDKIDYFSVRDSKTLHPIRDFTAPSHILVAAWLGKTRLIDNLAV
jgi:pantoate--beta-alanine ligase